jgi:hypothetical protein
MTGAMSGESNTHENGTGPPANVTFLLDEDEDDMSKGKLLHLVCMEARSVSVWALVAPLLRIALSSCGSMEWMLALFPAQQPGFIFASAWLLFVIREKFGPVPNVPIRLCETFMGRLSVREMCLCLPIHFVCTLSTFGIVKLVLPSNVVSLALAPLVYSQDNPWFLVRTKDYIHQRLVSCC